MHVFTKSTLAAAAVGALLAATPGTASAALTSGPQIVASDPSASAHFGSGVDVSSDGNTLLVGNQTKPGGLSSAYVFTKAGSAWTQTTILTAPDQTVNDTFGGAVALSGDGLTAVVGAGNRTVNGVAGAGAFYVFSNASGTWTQIAEVSSPSTVGGGFGGQLAVSNDGTNIVVGAPTDGANNAGVTYFYHRNTAGTYDPAGSIAGTSTYADLGYHVAISGDGQTAAIGEPYYQAQSGTSTLYYPTVLVMKFNGSTWSTQKVLQSPASGTTSSDGFGSGSSALSLNTNGTSLLVGASNTSYYNSTAIAGAAYLYTYANSAWSNSAVFRLSASSNLRLGQSGEVSADGSTVVLGQPNGTTSETAGGGSAWMWTKSSSTVWSSTPQSINSPDTASTDSFGYAISLPADPTHPVIANIRHTVNGYTQAGAVYAF